MDNNKLSLSMYFSLDADVLRQLAFLDVIMSESTGFVDFKKIGNDVFRENSGYLFYIYNEIAKNPNSNIKLFVTETPYREVKSFPSCLNFIKKYCYTPNMNIMNVTEKNDEAVKLARAYCLGYTDEAQGVVYVPSMKTFLSNEGETRISRDARNMAEATREGAIFITLNGQDYVFDKSLDDKNTIRRDNTIAINKALGYGQIVDGYDITPRPFIVNEIVPTLKHNNRNALKLAFADDKTKIKASEIIK